MVVNNKKTKAISRDYEKNELRLVWKKGDI